MPRDFTAIKTLQEVQDVLVGAKITRFEPGVLWLETLAGEKVQLNITAPPILLQIGGQQMSFAAKVLFTLQNLEKE